MVGPGRQISYIRGMPHLPDSDRRILARDDSSIRMFAPAKVNLTLEILGRLNDGFHLLHSLLCPLSIGDEVDLRILTNSAARSIRVRFSENLERQLRAQPGEERSFAQLCAELESPLNLAYRAADRLLSPRGYGFEILIHKSVPIGAGLGGGSGDAACVLLGAAKLLGVEASPELFEIAATLGADVPAMLLDRLLLMTGRGERLLPLRGHFVPHGDSPMLLVKPVVSVSTARAYSLLGRPAELTDEGGESLLIKRLTNPYPLLTLGVGIYSESWADPRLTLLPQEGIRDCTKDGGVQGNWLSCLENDFQKVVLREFPELEASEKELKRAGARHTLLCGSGSALLGFFADTPSRDSASSLLKENFPEWILAPVSLVPNCPHAVCR